MMAIGYFTLCFGGQTAQPYAQIDGQRYDVQISNYSDGPSSNADEARTILVDGQALAIRGHDDGSVALVAADGSVARTVAKESFASGGERTPFHRARMPPALVTVSIGNGFSKPNLSNRNSTHR